MLGFQNPNTLFNHTQFWFCMATDNVEQDENHSLIWNYGHPIRGNIKVHTKLIWFGGSRVNLVSDFNHLNRDFELIYNKKGTKKVIFKAWFGSHRTLENLLLHYRERVAVVAVLACFASLVALVDFIAAFVVSYVSIAPLHSQFPLSVPHHES